jgi:spore maturation protein SpmB
MSFSVLAGQTYAYQFNIIWRAATSASALAVNVSVPGFVNYSGTALINLQAGGTGQAVTLSSMWTGVLNSTAARIQATTVVAPGAAVNQTAQAFGTISVSTTGTLTLRLANNLTAASTSVVTIKAGTVGRVWRIA